MESQTARQTLAFFVTLHAAVLTTTLGNSAPHKASYIEKQALAISLKGLEVLHRIQAETLIYL